MNRRTLLAGMPAVLSFITPETDAVSDDAEAHEFSDFRTSSLYFRMRQYDVASERSGSFFTLHSWACGFIAHPASRSTYRKFPNYFDTTGAPFIIPGLPAMRVGSVERSADIFGEDTVLCSVSNLDNEPGALAICLNGVMVQLLCIEPAEGLDSDEAVLAIETIAKAIQERDPAFYGRGTMTRQVLDNHVATETDVKLVFPHLRLREDRYFFSQDDGISDFWE